MATRVRPDQFPILHSLDSEQFRLRTADNGGHSIPASDLSHGTLLALAMLTLAYLPNPPSLIGLEEPDRGIHPRLLRDIRDALYRLAYPESFGESRPPVQVIATTQLPHFLDQFSDHPGNRHRGKERAPSRLSRAHQPRADPRDSAGG